MAYRLAHTPRAEAEFLGLPIHVRGRVERWYDLSREGPRRAMTKPLEGHRRLRRAHAGEDDVIIYTVNDADHLIRILVVRVCHCGADALIGHATPARPADARILVAILAERAGSSVPGRSRKRRKKTVEPIRGKRRRYFSVGAGPDGSLRRPRIWNRCPTTW